MLNGSILNDPIPPGAPKLLGAAPLPPGVVGVQPPPGTLVNAQDALAAVLGQLATVGATADNLVAAFAALGGTSFYTGLPDQIRAVAATLGAIAPQLVSLQQYSAALAEIAALKQQIATSGVKAGFPIQPVSPGAPGAAAPIQKAGSMTPTESGALGFALGAVIGTVGGMVIGGRKKR